MKVNNERKTTVLHVIGSFSGGGMEANLLNFLHNVDFSRFRHCIVVGRDEGELRKEFHKLPVTIVSLKFSTRRYFYALPYGVVFCWRESIDIIHGHNYWSYLYCYFLSIITRIPLITSDYGLGTWKRERHLSWEAAIFRHAKTNIAVSKAILDKNQSLVEPHVGAQQKFKLVYPIIRHVHHEDVSKCDVASLRRKLGIRNDNPILTVIGRVIKVKGHRLAIDAVERLNSKGVHVNLLIVGRLDEPSILKKEDIDKEFIIYKEYYECLEEVWAASDIFLISSFSEGTPLVLVEYFALGSPVIASNISGNKELIEHGWNGFLFNSGDVDDLAYRIETVLASDNIGEIGANARKYYVENLSPSVVAKKIEDEYKAISQ